MRLIDADLIQYEPMLSAKGNGMYEDVMVAYKNQIDDLPTIEESKKRKWIKTDKHDIYYQPGYECSVCGVLTTCHGSYCPNCGADMRGEQE